MVLVLNGVLQTKYPQDSQSLYKSYPVYRDTAVQFLAIPNKIVGPAGLLYVMQRESASALPYDKNVSVIGSDEATTCIILILRHSGSGAVVLAHLDSTENDIENSIRTLIERVELLSIGSAEGRIEAKLVGGYTDPQGHSERLFTVLMQVFHRLPQEVDLTLLCVGQENIVMKGTIPWPAIYGIGIELKTGDTFPATFPDKGPDVYLRSARILTGNPNLLDIYDTNLGLLRIGPFNYKPLRSIDLWLEQNDEFILQHLSTSPDVEPPDYASNMRGTLKFIRDNPFPAVTIFRDNRPHYFRRDEHSGLWIPVTF